MWIQQACTRQGYWSGQGGVHHQVWHQEPAKVNFVAFEQIINNNQRARFIRERLWISRVGITQLLNKKTFSSALVLEKSYVSFKNWNFSMFFTKHAQFWFFIFLWDDFGLKTKVLEIKWIYTTRSNLFELERSYKQK